jgi:hypothetical protein
MHTFTQHDYKEYSVQASLAPYVAVREASHPTSVTVNKEFAWYVVGEVKNGAVHNPAVGYHYKDGPADSVKIVDKNGGEHDVPKGYAVFYLKPGDQPAGTLIDSRDAYRGAKYPAAGTYTARLVAGAISDDELAMAVPLAEGLYMLVSSHIAELEGAAFAVGAEAPVLVDTLWDWLVRPALALSPILFTGGVVAYAELSKRR